MTRYEEGFLTKCAEYGLDTDMSVQLMKEAQSMVARMASPGFQDRLGKKIENAANKPWYYPGTIPLRGVNWFRKNVSPTLNSITPGTVAKKMTPPSIGAHRTDGTAYNQPRGWSPMAGR